MAPIAFSLREEYAGTVEQDGAEVPAYTGGLIVAGDQDFDVRKALDEGDGVIVVDEDAHPGVVQALDEYPALKRVPAPEDAPADVVIGYADKTVPELRAELELRGVTGAGSANKPELVQALEAFDAIVAGGGEVTAGATLDNLLEA